MRTQADREASKRWKKANPQKVAIWNKAYKQRNASKIAASLKLWLLKHPGYRKDEKRKRKEKLASRPYTDICNICERKNTSQRRHAFDHCHKTGNFRGWLCTRCNTTLGRVNDDTELLLKMVSYLKKT